MRCRQVRNRLNESARADSKRTLDKEILEHLQSCQECARQAQAAAELRRAFVDNCQSDHIDRITWAQLQSQVEAQANLSQPNQSKETPLMSTLKSQLKRRPKLSLGLAVTAVALLAMTLIPLKFDRTIGFEVAVAGVDRDLAFNTEKINEMLSKLGLAEVAVDVTGCEKTCNLIITQLKSEGDAQLVAAAFGNLANSDCRVLVEVISESTTGNVIDKAGNVWFSTSDALSDSDIHQIIIERLGEDFVAGEMVFISESDENGEHTINIFGGNADGGMTWVTEDGETIDLAGNIDISFGSGAQSGDMIFHTDDGNTFEKKMICIIKEGDADMAGCMILPGHIVDGHLTDEARQAFEADGYVVEESQDAEGMLTITLTKEADGKEEVVVIKLATNESDDSAAKDFDNEQLPEKYALSQNYPNPFNPTTTIDYSLGVGGHVTIEVYNMAGQKVKTLVDRFVGPGEHSVDWDATSDSGDRVSKIALGPCRWAVPACLSGLFPPSKPL